MMLVVDAGNSYIKWKLWDGDNVIDAGRQALDGNVPKNFATYANNPQVRLILGSVASPQLEEQMKQLFPGRMHRVLTSSSCQGVQNAYQQPERMGVDRWAALLEAFYASGEQACCVFDLGTAATLDVVDNEGVHQGGFIVPGLQMMKSSLLSSTEGVRFDLNPGEDGDSGYGCSTAEAVHRGVQGMLVNWVLGEIRCFREHFPLAPVWLTGGDGKVIADNLVVENVKFCEDLVLDGLRRMAIG